MSPEEVGKEIAHHAKDTAAGRSADRHDRILSIAEAVLLSIVALMAAWSGYAAAKWSTESRVKLAEASTLRSEANRATSTRSTSGTSTPRRSTRGSPRSPSTTSRRWRSRSVASAPSSRLPSTPGAERTPRQIRTRRRAPPTCPSTRNPRSRGEAPGRRGDDGLRGRLDRGDPVRRLRSHHGLPGERPLPGGHQHAVPVRRVRYALIALEQPCSSSRSCS